MRKILIIYALIISIICTIIPIQAYEKNTYLNKEQKHYYYEMNDEYKKIYDCLLKGIVEFEKEINIPEISPYDLYEIIVKIRADFPEIFWLGTNYSYQSIDKKVEKVIFNYVYTQEEIDNINKQIFEICEKIKEKTEKLSDYAKARYIFNWVCENIDYNNNTENAVNCEQAFLKGDAICGGFAKSYALIAQYVGLKCNVIIGARTEESTVAHAWDEVFISDRKVLIDCTWGDHTAISKPNKYFDTDEEEFYEKHKNIILHE